MRGVAPFSPAIAMLTDRTPQSSTQELRNIVGLFTIVVRYLTLKGLCIGLTAVASSQNHLLELLK